MPKSAYKWKRTENESQNAWTKFQETGSPLERKILRSSGPLRPARYWLHKRCARAEGPSTKIHARAWNVPLERASNSAKMLGARFSRSSGHYPARADLKNLGFPDRVLELQISFPSTFLACNGSNYTFTHANMLLMQITTLGSSITWIIYMHVPNCLKPIINMLKFNIQDLYSHDLYMHVGDAHHSQLRWYKWWLQHELYPKLHMNHVFQAQTCKFKVISYMHEF